MRQLDNLARVWLALWRRLYNVDVAMVLGSKHTLKAWKKKHHLLSRRMQEYDLSILIVTQDNLELLAAFGDKPGVYLVNPRKYAILAYDGSNFSDAIFHDLKHILSNE